MFEMLGNVHGVQIPSKIKEKKRRKIQFFMEIIKNVIYVFTFIYIKKISHIKLWRFLFIWAMQVSLN